MRRKYSAVFVRAARNCNKRVNALFDQRRNRQALRLDARFRNVWGISAAVIVDPVTLKSL